MLYGRGRNEESECEKPAKKSSVSKSRKPVDLEAVRAMVANTVAGQALGITSALADEAKKGDLAHAKFLFEMIGLYPVTEAPASEEDQDAEEGKDLARVLLQRLALQGSGDDAEETTEIVGVTATGDSVE
jgi:hypothetical protein